MQRSATLERRLLWFLQRHERALIVVWLAGCALVLALLGGWGVLLGGAERAVEAWDTRWVRTLDALEKQVRAGDFAAAAEGLERLDRDQPAVFIKHRDDKQRERLLALLAECDVALDRRRSAIKALERLVAFDPRNFDNHFRLAEAQRAFGDTDAAREAYEAVLAFHPTHLPSVTALVELAFDAGEYAPVVDVWERYLDAWVLGRVRLSLGGETLDLEAPVDGRQHVVEAALQLAPGTRDALCIETRGWSARVGAIELVAPLRVGEVAERQVRRLQPGDGWTQSQAERLGPGDIAALNVASSLCTGAVELPHGATCVRLEITLFKATPGPLWHMVETSYRNRLELERLRSAVERSRVGGCLEAGSQFAD